MRGRADAAEFGIGDVVLGDDVGHQRAHAHEPAADADQHQRQRRQDRVQQHAGDEAKIEAARQVHLRAAADRQHRPEVAEDDQQHEGDDVVGDRMEPHRHDAGQPQQAAVAIIAGEPAQQVAETPGEQGGEAQQPRGPRQRPPDQHRDRRRERRQRRAEIAERHALPEHQVLLQQAALQPVELAQRLAHQRDRLGAGAAERRAGGDGLLDRIDRRRVRDEEGDVDADEHHQHELAEPAQQVGRIGTHPTGAASASPSCSACCPSSAPDRCRAPLRRSDSRSSRSHPSR